MKSAAEITKDTSLFKIQKYFSNLTNYDTELDYVSWLETGNVGKITFEMDKYKLLYELLDYMKIEYYKDYPHIQIVKYEYIEIRSLFRSIPKTRKIKNILIDIMLINASDDRKEYFNIRVNNKEAFGIAERIAKEIVNYIGIDVKIRF